MADTGAQQQLDAGFGPPQSGTERDPLGLSRVVDMFRRRLWLFLVTAGLVLFLVALATVTATRLYTANTELRLEIGQKDVLSRNNAAIAAGQPPSDSEISTETQILTSRALAGRVLDAMAKSRDKALAAKFQKEFVPPMKRSILDQVLNRPSKTTPAQVRENAMDRLIKRLSVKRRDLTFLVDVRVTSRDPQVAAALANVYAHEYGDQQLDAKYDTIQRAHEWMAARLEELRGEVEKKERAVAEYKASHDLQSSGGVRLNEQAASQYNLQIADARAKLRDAQSKYYALQSEIRRGGSPETSAAALASPVVAALRAQQADLSRKQAEASIKLGPKHPQLLQLQQEQQGLKEQLNAEISRIAEAMRTEVAIAQQAVAESEGGLVSQRQELAQNEIAAVSLRQLERDADAARALYEGMLTRMRSIAEQSDIELEDARIISSAAVPQAPSFPNTKLNLLIGLIAGVALGVAAVFIAELMERTLRTTEDVEQKLGVSCLGAVPALDARTLTIDGQMLSPEDFVLKRPLSAFGEALRAIRAWLFFTKLDQPVKVVCVTSAVPNEGKTTTAIGLARIAALAGSKTIFVDCDLRRRSATHALGMDVDKGLVEHLFADAPLESVIRKDAGSGMDVLPLAQAEFTPRDTFSSESMRKLLATLRANYDVVIIDSAPVMPLSDARVLGALADAVVVAARWGATPSSMTKNAIDQLRSHGARIAGVVLQRVESNWWSRLIYDQPDYYNELYQTYYIR